MEIMGDQIMLNYGYEEEKPLESSLNCLIYFLAFLLSIAVAILLLLLGACFPADAVSQHVRQSADFLVEEGDYPGISDKYDASILDNWTDAIMLMESMSTSISHPETILTNPMFKPTNSLVESLKLYSNDPSISPTEYYSRYWMGFRVTLRPALSFLRYYELRIYNAILLFSLFAALIVSMTKRVGSQASFSFALSWILVRPHVICNSLQYSNCFLLAFVLMLMIPYISERVRYHSLFFMEAGIATMFFDFYTTPLITFALPAMYLWLLQKNDGKEYTVRKIVSSFLFWLVGYLFMWIAKLFLTDLFTSAEGFKYALRAVKHWTLDPVVRQGDTITPIVTAQRIVTSIIANKDGAAIWGSAALLLLGYLISSGKNREKYAKNIKNNLAVLIFAALVCLWFIVTYKPTAVHAAFQYRSVVVAFWANFLMIFYPAKEKETH